MSADPGPPTQLCTQNTKWKNFQKVLRGVRREHNMGTNCVAGSAESTKWRQIVLSEDPKLKYIIPIFWHNLVNEDRHKSILCSRRTRHKTQKVTTQNELERHKSILCSRRTRHKTQKVTTQNELEHKIPMIPFAFCVLCRRRTLYFVYFIVYNSVWQDFAMKKCISHWDKSLKLERKQCNSFFCVQGASRRALCSLKAC